MSVAHALVHTLLIGAAPHHGNITAADLYSNVAKIDVGPQPITQNELEQGAKLYRSAWVAPFDREKVEPAYFDRFAAHSVQFPEQIAGASVLCIGARLGGEVRAFTRLGALAVGIDLNPGFRNPHVLWGDATALQFANATFDIAYSNVLDHIPQRVVVSVFEEVRRVLKPGGHLFVDMDAHAPDIYAANSIRTFRAEAPAMWTALNFRLVRERPFCRSTTELVAAQRTGDCVRVPLAHGSNHQGGTAWVLQRESRPAG